MTAADLTRLGEAYFVTQHGYDPYNATLLGIAEFDGLSFNPSREAGERAATELAAIGRQVREIGTAGITDDQRVDHGVLTALVDGARSDAEYSLWAANASAKGYVSRQGLIFQAVYSRTATTSVNVRNEIDRYIAWPGPALAADRPPWRRRDRLAGRAHGHPLSDRFRVVTAPTLVTVGRHDWVTPVSAAQTITSLLPNARLAVFEKSGHSPQSEERELFLATMRDFLNCAVPA